MRFKVSKTLAVLISKWFLPWLDQIWFVKGDKITLEINNFYVIHIRVKNRTQASRLKIHFQLVRHLDVVPSICQWS